MNDTYTFMCKHCEYLYHCYGRDIAIKIKGGNCDDLCMTGNCDNFYPEI